MQDFNQLLGKYDIPAPRYTSYPTVPFWKEGPGGIKWQEAFRSRFHSCNQQEGISLYIHLPFCEALCTYCGCNKKITTNHSVEDRYLRAIIKEWVIYTRLMKEPPVIREIHLGGGTPTFFSPANLARLLDAILIRAAIHPQHEFSLEGHPNNTTRAHLEKLYERGFRRISYGVQDNNPDIQLLINRIQPFDNVKKATEMARETGFLSVNFDLIYGLPRQDREKLAHTVETSLSLRPDRIALYSYAHVPWVSRGQRLFDEQDLPSAAEKLASYLRGREILTGNGYADIGLDHFSLPTDDLYTSWKNGELHRNFMGYTSRKSGMLIGLGVSAISDFEDAFTQNSKTLGAYYEAIESGRPALEKGYSVTEEDKVFRKYILDITCRGKTRFLNSHLPVLKKSVIPALRELEKDGLLHLDPTGLELTETGRYFMRNVCKAFDLHLLRSNAAGEQNNIFSKAI